MLSKFCGHVTNNFAENASLTKVRKELSGFFSCLEMHSYGQIYFSFSNKLKGCFFFVIKNYFLYICFWPAVRPV